MVLFPRPPPFINTTPSFLPSSPLNLQTVQGPPFLGNPPPISLYQFFVKSPLKVGFFSERPKYQSFSSVTPSYLLKVTKFLVNISQFEFLVMTEKNIFVYIFVFWGAHYDNETKTQEKNINPF